jgi:putative addiction module component (TIGR02574 family)
MSATELIEKLRPMPTEEKRAFVEQVWEEFGEELGWVDPDLTPEQTAELDRRLAEFEKNPHDGIPWEQVQAEMKQRFGWA